MRTYTMESGRRDAESPLIRWGAIFGGLVAGFGVLVLMTTLWFALAYGSEMEEIRANLEWYVGGSAVGALFIAGILTGYLSGVHGAGTGFVHGITLWALLLVFTLVVGIPSVLNVFNLGQVVTEATDGLLAGAGADTLWATFWSIVIGFVAAGFGGSIGGLATRGGSGSTVVEDEAPTIVDDDDDDDHDHERDGRVVTSGSTIH